MKASKKQVRSKGFSPILFFGLLIGLGVIWSKSYPKEKSTEFSEQPPIAKPEETGFIVNIPQRGYFKSKVNITVEAPQGTACELAFITPDGIESEADGLGMTVADDSGLCSWDFVIEEASRKGSGRLIFYINGISETHFIEIWRP